MFEFLKVILGFIAFIVSSIIWEYFVEDFWDWEDMDFSNFIFLVVSILFIWFATRYAWTGFGIIFIIFGVIATVNLILEDSYSSMHLVYSIIVCVLLGITITNNITKVAWDIEPCETQVIECPVIGTSDENIVIKITENGNTSLKPIRMSSMNWCEEEVWSPYVCREIRIYNKYDYRKDPPEILESEERGPYYTLYGSEKQIQDLFGYEVEFNFEQ